MRNQKFTRLGNLTLNPQYREVNPYFLRKKNWGDLVIKLKLNTTLRLYSLHELKQMLLNSGWKYVKSYGSLSSLGPVDLRSENIICIGNKK